MVDVFQDWLNEKPENARFANHERVVMDVSEEVLCMLAAAGITKKELAERLEKSLSNVSQMLNGNRNLTIRTLADIAFVCEKDVRIRFVEKYKKPEWNNVSNVVQHGAIRHVFNKPSSASGADQNQMVSCYG